MFKKEGKKHRLIIKDTCIDDEGDVTVKIGKNKSQAKLFVDGKFSIVYSGVIVKLPDIIS